ncbi:MAG: S41 family peptidase [Anaerovoracaceae bacterium]
MKIKKKSFIVLLIIVFLLGGLTSGLLISLNNGGIKSYAYATYMAKKYAKAEGIMKGIEKNYYQDVNENEIMDMMYRGIVAGLNDKYSAYMTKEEFEEYKNDLAGEFEGIGATFRQTGESEFTIVDVIKDSPAQKAGIKVKDIIVKVDDKKYTKLDEVGHAVRGKKGTKVKITYLRAGKTYSKSIIRDRIVTESVNVSNLNDDIAYLKISSFDEETAKRFKAELNKIEASDSKGLIIDLRDNGGGLVDQAIKITDELMGKAKITYLQNKEGKQKEYWSDSNKTSLPYVILVNEKTASASEILTAAIKDEGEGKIVGTKTYGKGVIQSTSELKDGDAVKLTIMEYYSPKGYKIHQKGIVPNYVIKSKENQLKKAIDLLS